MSPQNRNRSLRRCRIGFLKVNRSMGQWTEALRRVLRTSVGLTQRGAATCLGTARAASLGRFTPTALPSDKDGLASDPRRYRSQNMSWTLWTQDLPFVSFGQSQRKRQGDADGSLHIEEGLQSLGRRIEKSKKALDRGQLERQIGRLLGQNLFTGRRRATRSTLLEDKTVPAGVRLKWNARPEWDDWARLSEGTYILRSNIHDWTDEQLVEDLHSAQRSRGRLSNLS